VLLVPPTLRTTRCRGSAAISDIIQGFHPSKAALGASAAVCPLGPEHGCSQRRPGCFTAHPFDAGSDRAAE